MAFALELLPKAGPDELGPETRLLGLSLALRLALTAQASGASAIVCRDELAPLLRDARLTIPIVRERPSGSHLVRVRENAVLHRGLLGDAKKIHGDRDWDVLDDPHPFDPPFGFQPMVVTNRKVLGVARSALLRALRKPQDGWTSTYMNRHVSLFFTRFLVATPLRPNQVSIFILAVGLAGAWCAYHGTYWWIVIGAVLFHLQSVLDGCDGEMSRLTFRGSVTGEWLDTIGDDLTNYSFFGALGFGLWRTTQNPLHLAITASILFAGLSVAAIEYRYLIKIGSGDLLKYPIGVGTAQGGEGFIDKYIAPLTKRDTFVFSMVIAALLGVPWVISLLCAVGAPGILVMVLKAEHRMWKEARAARASATARARG